MTNDDGRPPESADDTVDDSDAALLTRLLTDLADDPGAPPSTVSSLSVIAAARVAARRSSDAGGREGADIAAATEIDLRPVSAITAGSGGDVEAYPSTPSVGELHIKAAQAEAARTQHDRRRKGVLTLVAAASVAALAAVVIPLSISGTSTTGSANSAGDAASALAATDLESEVAESGAEGGAAAPALPTSAGAEAGGGAAAPASSASAGGAAGVAPESAAADANRPPPGPDALTELVPRTEGPAAATPVAPESSCWPALSESAAGALTAALPAGAFGAPNLLDLDCGADPVAGATLPGTTPGTVLVVRVSKAEPGACARGGTEAGVRCVPSGDGTYLSTDGGDQVTAFAYGGGNEVIVSGTLAAMGAAPAASGLTDEQSIAAAQAVLGAL